MTPVQKKQQAELARKRKEMLSLFADPRFARQAWQSVGRAIAMRPATPPVTTYDKDGNPTYNSEIERYGYDSLTEDVDKLLSDDPGPTQIEMILACQMIKARTDTAAATFIRDTLGAKPVDESKIEQRNINTYETLTDEELELLQQHRELERIKKSAVSSEESPAPPSPPANITLANSEE
jgi:hypothetical protein